MSTSARSHGFVDLSVLTCLCAGFFPAVVAQDYLTQVLDEAVLRGNSAILKCVIPSFVADFVSVQAWVDLEGKAYTASDRYGTRGAEQDWPAGGNTIVLHFTLFIVLIYLSIYYFFCMMLWSGCVHGFISLFAFQTGPPLLGLRGNQTFQRYATTRVPGALLGCNESRLCFLFTKLCSFFQPGEDLAIKPSIYMC